MGFGQETERKGASKYPATNVSGAEVRRARRAALQYCECGRVTCDTDRLIARLTRLGNLSNVQPLHISAKCPQLAVIPQTVPIAHSYILYRIAYRHSIDLIVVLLIVYRLCDNSCPVEPSSRKWSSRRLNLQPYALSNLNSFYLLQESGSNCLCVYFGRNNRFSLPYGSIIFHCGIF
jgi:hypothetical protein